MIFVSLMSLTKIIILMGEKLVTEMECIQPRGPSTFPLTFIDITIRTCTIGSSRSLMVDPYYDINLLIFISSQVNFSLTKSLSSLWLPQEHNLHYFYFLHSFHILTYLLIYRILWLCDKDDLTLNEQAIVFEYYLDIPRFTYLQGSEIS